VVRNKRSIHPRRWWSRGKKWG